VYRRFVWRRFVEETFCRGDVLSRRRFVHMREVPQSAKSAGSDESVFTSMDVVLYGLLL
jgi:hypothetical protein